MLATVYIADSDKTVSRSIQFLLASENISAKVFSDGSKLIASALKAPPGCIIAETLLPDMPGITLINRLAIEGLHMPVILLSRTNDIPSAVAAVKRGAWDYLEKPFMQHMLLDSVSRAIAIQKQLG